MSQCQLTKLNVENYSSMMDYHTGQYQYWFSKAEKTQIQYVCFQFSNSMIIGRYMKSWFKNLWKPVDGTISRRPWIETFHLPRKLLKKGSKQLNVYSESPWNWSTLPRSKNKDCLRIALRQAKLPWKSRNQTGSPKGAETSWTTLKGLRPSEIPGQDIFQPVKCLQAV